MFTELAEKSKDIRQMYYDGKIMNGEVCKYVNNMVQSCEGDFSFQKDEKIGTTVYQKHMNESEVYHWFYHNQEETMKCVE